MGLFTFSKSSGGVKDNSNFNFLVDSTAFEDTDIIHINTKDGIMSKQNINSTIFTGLDTLSIDCEYIYSTGKLTVPVNHLEFPNLIEYNGVKAAERPTFIYGCNNVEEMTFPKLQKVNSGFSYDDYNSGFFISNCENLKRLYFPELIEFRPLAGSTMGYGSLVHTCINLEELHMPKWNGYSGWRFCRRAPQVRWIELGHIEYVVPTLYSDTSYPLLSCVRLIKLEIKGANVNLLFHGYKPTMALRTDVDAEDYEDLKEDMSFNNNLEQFLYNFKTYIAERLDSRVGLKALTLNVCQEVFDVLTSEITKIITDKNWNIAVK